MTREAIRSLLLKQPFEPFLVRMTSGETYRLLHPECGGLLENKLIVSMADSDRFVVCTLLEIAAVEPLALAEPGT